MMCHMVQKYLLLHYNIYILYSLLSQMRISVLYLKCHGGFRTDYQEYLEILHNFVIKRLVQSVMMVDASYQEH